MNKSRNYFLAVSAAMILAAVPVCASAQAQGGTDPRPDYVASLDESNIRYFLNEVAAITTGRRPDMLDDDVIDYFANHMADKGEFKSVMKYQIPGFPTQDIEMEFTKEQYINTVVNGRYMLEDYKTDIDIQDLKIHPSGKSATFKSVTKETGRMPFAKDADKNSDTQMLPIEGVSNCEQKIIVSFNNFIQMAAADCSTLISFDPFAGKPLVPD